MKKFTSLLAFLMALVLCMPLAAPALAVETAADFPVHATAAILVDADYNEVLFEHNADEKRFPASITKVMTGLLTVEAVAQGKIALDTQVTLQGDLYTGIGEGGSTQGLKPGEILTVRDLLNCALIPSANEACNALAVAITGSIPTFVELMNQRAQELGMVNTHFNNTHGYHDENHYTTARDISLMCMEAMKYPDFRQVVSSVSYTVPATNMHEERVLHDTNALVSTFRITHFYYPYAIGIKTGSTPEAGYCLASAAEKNGQTMIAVVLGGEKWKVNDEINPNNYFTQSKDLLEHGFNDFERKQYLDPVKPVGTIPVTLCEEQDYVTVQPANGLEACMPKSLDPSVFEQKITLPETLEAPIEKGQKVGTISLSYEGQSYGEVDLITTTALERSQFMYTMARLKAFFGQLWVKIVLIVVAVLIVLLILRHLIFGGRRGSRSGGSRSYRSSYRGRRR